jgi:ABC-type Zn uptake system ZnuABC Zn-binding protein ZnuA
LVVAVIALSACSPGGSGSDGDLPSVVATTTQIGSVAAEVGGDQIVVTVLLQPGAEAHDFEMTPAAAAAIEDADLLLRSGAGLEGWLDDALRTIGGHASLRDMSEGVALRETADGAGHADDDAGEDGHAVDPHYWLSGPNAIQMVTNVRDALTEASPAAGAAFAERAGALVARLESADDEARSLIEAIPEADRAIVTNHDALGYFIDEYGLRFVGSIFPTLDAAAEPSAGELAQLVETIRREGVRAIFSESAVNPDLALAIAAETDAIVVEVPLYTDSLGPPGSGAETLDGMLVHNARVIHDALSES